MRRSTSLIALACAVAAVAVGSAGLPLAFAAGGNAIINDCQSSSNGQLSHNYTVAQLQHALAVMPASVKEYTDCPDVIEHALQQHKRTGGSGGSGGGSGGSFLPTPVIVILVVLILAAVTFGALAIRRRQDGGEGPVDRGDGTGGPGDEPGEPGSPAAGDAL